MTLDEFIKYALQEDIGSGDHSSLASIPANAIGKAHLKVKQNGIIAGVEVAKKILEIVDNKAALSIHITDGTPVAYGDIVFDLEASVHTILKAERLILNIMQRMSGIASLTHTYVDKIKQYSTKLLDTRKTTPNFRWFEKKAVLIGGGYNHRFGLYDMIMLKDNHIDFCGGIEKAIDKTNQYLKDHNLELPIEIETRNLDEVQRVVQHGGVQRIMLDNFTPENISLALNIIQKQFETEASGGITFETIEDYAKTGVDFISSGAIIHHATSMDLSLKAIK
ncbi:MAG: carboxylating nicotinate-nucleotide diphosphorylase [Chitinophagaceae bacterium]